MNRGFLVEIGRACLLDVPNIDTDIIIPQTELVTTSRSGLGDGLFARWRYTQGRIENPGFVLNRDANRRSRFLIAANNFGCGSSREHAVWALQDFGIRAVVSSKFGEIFRTNCIRNGILAATVTEEGYAEIAELARKNGGGLEMSVDLQQRVIHANSAEVPFQIDSGDRERLLNGLDEIAETLAHIDAIKTFAEREATRSPWLHWSTSLSPEVPPSFTTIAVDRGPAMSRCKLR